MRRPAVSADPGWWVRSRTMVLAFSVRVSMALLPFRWACRTPPPLPAIRTYATRSPGRACSAGAAHVAAATLARWRDVPPDGLPWARPPAMTRSVDVAVETVIRRAPEEVAA